VIVTVAAPIRLPARTVAALNVLIRDYLAEGVIGPASDETTCGNRVRLRIVRSRFRGAPKVIVFVCNPEPAPGGLIDLAADLLA
jgi:hypothetical protein